MPAGEDAGTIPPMGLGQRREQYSLARRSSGVSDDTPRWKRIRSKCGQSTFEHVADFWLGEGTAPPGARTSVWLVPSSQGRSPSNEGFRAKSTVSERTWVLVSVAPAGRGQPETA